jgi:CSLREA domain-containing protein
MILTFSRMFRLLAIFLVALAFSVPLSRPLPARAGTLTVDTLTDETDTSCSDGDCSLRDAMLLAVLNAGPDRIEFNEYGTGTIVLDPLLGLLPPLTGGLTVIDGTTAPGYAAAGHPVVLIDGSNTSVLLGIKFGIAIYSNENAVQGLAIHSFADGCIEIEESNNNVIADSVLSNCSDGVMIAGRADGNIIQDSFIGTNLTGTSAWGNSYAGVYLNHSLDYPGPTMTEILDNVISGNIGAGIVLRGKNIYQTEIKGNYIGVAADGVSPLGNGAAGIDIGSVSFENYIGGYLEGDGNIIAYNASVIPDTGIEITGQDSDGNRISHNSIYDNTGLGIDLGDDGVTCNSPSEDGPNDFIPCPVINSATTSLVSGTTCPNCIVEVFIADPDPSGYGEGRTFLGDTETTDGNFAVPVSGVADCDWLTATAIGQNDDYGNTSEFALNVQVPCTQRTPTPVHRRTATPTTEPTNTPRPPTPTLPPPPAPTGTPAGGAGPAIAPPSTGEGAAAGGCPWPVVALVLAGAVAATATGAVGLRARGSHR